MRVDAKSLLSRLGRPDFSYREFSDRFSDMELWPVFEALLKDPRLQSLDHRAEPFGAVAPADTAPGDAAPAADQSLSSLFRHYETGAVPGAVRRPAPAAQDIRSILQHLSELGDEGRL